MFEAQTPQGKVYWLDELEDPLIGSPVVIVKLREAAENGLQASWPANAVDIDLLIPGDVRFALEVLYGSDVTFSDNAPEASPLIEPVEPGLIY